MYPHERSLVKQLADKPFALIGVNSDDNLEDIRSIVAKKNLTWRSFQNESSAGTISDKWAVQAWPTIFVLDAKGVIRFRGHEEGLDEIIEELLAELGHRVEIVMGDPGENQDQSKKKMGKDQSKSRNGYGATLDAANEAACKAMGGYWHNGKCWRNAGNDGIARKDIDRVVAEQLVEIRKARIVVGAKSHQIEFAFPEIEDEEFQLIIGFNDLQEFLLVECTEDQIESKKPFTAKAALVAGNIFDAEDEGDIKFTAHGEISVEASEDFDVRAKGKLAGESGEKINVRFDFNEALIGSGASKLKVRDGQAFLSGTLGTVTYDQVKDLIKKHPEINTITLTDVEGSVNDAVNMHTGRLVREAGLNTRVLADSEIASGGVDLFCAGVKRFAEKGARIGVHSWGGNGYTATDIPTDHPDHRFQIAYFKQVLGEQHGPKFYFYTLQAAPFDGIHWMSVKEINDWKVVTDWAEPGAKTERESQQRASKKSNADQTNDKDEVEVEEFMKELDRNNDGKIHRSEVPEEDRDDFDEADQNADGVVTRRELQMAMSDEVHDELDEENRVRNPMARLDAGVLRAKASPEQMAKLNSTESVAADARWNLDQISKRGGRVTRNAQGHHEATFPDGHVLVFVPQGSFAMGTDSLKWLDRPVHTVGLRGYWIGKYLVTNAQFKQFVDDTNFKTDAEQPESEGPYVYDFKKRYFKPTPGRTWRDSSRNHVTNHPVTAVSWHDSQAFSRWLGGKLKLRLRLPTEAEWEKAARGTNGRRYPWGNTAPDGTQCNFCDSQFAKMYPRARQGNPDLKADDDYPGLSPVDTFAQGASPYGVFDMGGNVSNWVADWVGEYPNFDLIEPKGPVQGNDRCMRGGFWVADAGLTKASIQEQHNCRGECRSADDPRSSDDHLEFRFAMQFESASDDFGNTARTPTELVQVAVRTNSIKATRIAKIPAGFPAKYRNAFNRYVQVIAPNGKPINIFAQKEITDAQLRHVREVMLHYLTDMPGSEFGKKKGAIADRMADNRAMMMICKGRDGQFREPRINAQPLYADETIVEGTSAYINNEFEDHRDASLEEILHCVHDNGIGVDVRGAPKGVAPKFQKEIRAATTHAMQNGIWPTRKSKAETAEWIDELRDEGSLTQEYLASVIDSYYGLWGPFDENFGMWGIYIARTRKDIERKDPKGYAIVRTFFHPYLTYNAEIDRSFEGTFSMTFDKERPYTHKSRYLLNAHLTGSNNSNLKGNDQDNTLGGNAGNNVIDGADGQDTVVFSKPKSAYKVTRHSDGSITVIGEGTDKLISVEHLEFDGAKKNAARFVMPVNTSLR